MKVMVNIAVIIFIFSLSGCTPGVMGENVMGYPGSPAWHGTASTQTKVAHFKKTCSAYGISDGTPQMATCVQKEILSSKQMGK